MSKGAIRFAGVGAVLALLLLSVSVFSQVDSSESGNESLSELLGEGLGDGLTGDVLTDSAGESVAEVSVSAGEVPDSMSNESITDGASESPVPEPSALVEQADVAPVVETAEVPDVVDSVEPVEPVDSVEPLDSTPAEEHVQEEPAEEEPVQEESAIEEAVVPEQLEVAGEEDGLRGTIAQLVVQRGDSRVHPEVFNQLGSSDAISVIVLLNEPSSEEGRGVSAGDARVARRAKASQAKEAFFAGRPKGVSDAGLQVLREYYSIGAFEIRVDESGLAALQANPAVAKVLPNLERRIDDTRGEISGAEISLNESGPVVNSDDVANLTVNGTNLTGHGEAICVLDTGIDTSHLFFGPVVEGSNIVGGIFGGYDFVNNDTNVSDDNNHGTHVSGIAVGNFSPYFGTARNAQVVPVKVCNAAGSCPDAALLAGVDYCVNNVSVGVISGSLGGGAPLNSSTCSGDSLFASLEPLLSDALAAGIIPVFASGNNGCGAGCTTGVDYPACSPQVISVGSTTKADAISTFTDRGGDRFDIYAPGQSITSSIPTFNTIQSVSGTSQATPHVSGAIAVLQQNEVLNGRARLNLSVVRQLLQQTGVFIAPNNSRLDMLSIVARRNANLTLNQTTSTVVDVVSNSSLDFAAALDLGGVLGCVDVHENFVGVNSTLCPQYNQSAHVILGGVTSPGQPLRDGVPCPADVCGNVTLTSRGLEMDVTGFSNFTSVPGCGITINESASLNQSINATGSCITFGADNIELDCEGFTITFGINESGVGINATGRTNTTIRNCVLEQTNVSVLGSTHAVLLSGGSFNQVVNVSAVTNAANTGIQVTAGEFNSTIENVSVISRTLGAAFGLVSFSTENNTLRNVSAYNSIGDGLRVTGGNNLILDSVVRSAETVSLSFGGLSLGQRDNTVRNTVISGTAVALRANAGPNVLTNVTVYSNASNGIAVYFDSGGSVDVNISNSTIMSEGAWIASIGAAGSNNSFENVSFATGNGSIRFPGIFYFPNSTTLNQSELSLAENRSFVNSTNVSFLNVSAQVTFDNLPFVNPRPLVDFEDDGSFEKCSMFPSQCQEISYNGSTFVFNVSGFTSYAASETVFSCPETIVEDSALNQSLNGTAGCITFGADNIELDCQGFQIMFANTSFGIGINATGRTNVTVRNCDVIANQSFTSAHAILFSNTSNSFVLNSSGNSSGMSAAGIAVMAGSTSNLVANSTGRANISGGITVSGSLRTNLTNNTGFGMVSPGIHIDTGSDHTFLWRSSGNSALDRGITVSSSTNVTVQENVGSGPGAQGILLTSCTTCILARNNGTGGPGITAAPANNLVATNNTGFGGLTFTGNNLTVINNTGSASNDRGISFTATNSLMQDNIGSSNSDVGIRFVGSTGNTISRNNGTSGSGSGMSFEVGSNNNSLSSVIGQSGSGDGILFSASSGNNLANAQGLSSSLGGVQFVSASENNTVAGGTFLSDTGSAVRFGTGGGVNNSFSGVVLQSNQTWIRVVELASADNNFTNTSFDDPAGRISIIGNFTMPGAGAVNRTNLNISLNVTFINSTNVPFLNQSAQITLRNLPFASPRPLVDVNDSGVFEFCDSSRCTLVSQGAGVIVFNVTSFTAYAAEEGGGVSISKADSADPVVRGALFNYTIMINNSNNVSVFNVTLAEGYPAGVAFVSSTPAPSAGNGTFNLGTLAANSSTTVNITVRVGSNVANGTVLNNSINVSSQVSNGTQTLLNVSELTVVQGIPVITTAKTDSPDPVPRGTTLSYQINITNSGDEVAYNLTIVEGYPANVAFNGSAPAPSAGNNTFSIVSLLPSSSFLINITLNVSPLLANGSTLNNSYNVTFANLTGTNATVSNSTLTTVLGSPNISAVKTDTVDPVFAGDQFVYRITLNNTGDDAAFNITVVEGYPTGVSFVSSQPVPSAGNNTFSVGNLSPSSSFLINITLAVGNDQINGTLLNNTVNISFANRTGQSAVANASENTTVLQPPFLVVNKTANQTAVVKGTTINYTITVNNTGSTTAFNVTVLELYPTGVSFVSSQPAPTSGNGTFNVGTLLPNESTTINLTINFSVTLTNATIKNNSLNVTANRSDGRNVSPQNTSAAVTVVGFPQVSVVKSDTPDPVVNGTVLTYVITVTNGGDEIAYNVTVTEGYPANVTLLTTQPVPTPDNATFPIGNLLPGQTFLINITVNVSGSMTSGQLNNSVNATFANASGVSLALQNSTLTTVIPPPVFAGGGGGGGGGGASGVSTTQSMSGNSMTTAYLRAGDKVKFSVEAQEHTMTVLTVLTDRVTIRVASVPQEFTLRKGVVQAVDVTGDGQGDVRISVTDIAYSKALFYLEKAAFSPAVAREPVNAPEPVKEPAAPAPEPEKSPEPVVEASPEEVPESLPEAGEGGVGAGGIAAIAVLLVVAGILGAAFYWRKGSGGQDGDALSDARKIEDALKSMKTGVKESERLVKKAEKIDRKDKR